MPKPSTTGTLIIRQGFWGIIMLKHRMLRHEDPKESYGKRFRMLL